MQTVIDVGASNGSWSKRVMKYFPEANYLLVEAQEAAHGLALKEFKATHGNVDYALCAAGNRDGQIHFDADRPLGGAASETAFETNDTVIPMRAVDTLVRERDLRGPYLLKLDTHGFEVPILEGAGTVLSQAAMLIIEAYNFTICRGALRFHELCAYLEPRGFRCADIFDLMVRPLDQSFWQMDMVFLPSQHKIFQSNLYGS
ncbi:MAG TPA: FkbM family methyltransferase [Candidatus Acidoferrum sp.]